MANAIDFLGIISTILSITTLIVSITALVKSKLLNNTKIEIRNDGKVFVIEGTEKDVRRQVEEIANTFLNKTSKTETESESHKLKSLEDIGMDSQFLKMIDNLKDVISSLVGTSKIWFSVKVIDGEMVKTVFSSRNQVLANIETERMYRLADQTEYFNIVNGDEYFFCSNMMEYANEYKNSNSTWNYEYNSCIVVPITVDKKILGFFTMNGSEALSKIDASATVLSIMKMAVGYIEALLIESDIE